MMGTEAPFLTVLTFGPSEPSQHCPLLEFAFRPRALKPSVVSWLRLIVLLDDAAGAELAAGAAATVAAAEVAAGEAEDVAEDAELALAPTRASFIRLAIIVSKFLCTLISGGLHVRNSSS
jgi:hypothetical protein